MKIHKLPESLIHKIAAGEVVERPASVLKELMENALDAGAGAVHVEWKEAGRKLLKVTDDGCGMTPEEARLALERHATSKIGSLEDLENLRTFGFRGEALPSIAAVSRFRLLTRAAGAPEGWSLEMEGGTLLREGPSGAPLGTSASAEDLFFSTPARKKFLKSDASERGLLLRAVEDTALASPRLHMSVRSDNKDILTLPAAKNGAGFLDALRERIRLLWGPERASSLKRAHAEGRFITVRGWISDVHASQGSARFQRLFVNGRPIQHRRLAHALYEAYRGSLMSGRHPLAVLFLDLDPSLVDVNVHPAKREVRFSNEEEILGFFFRALRDALAESASMPTTTLRNEQQKPVPYSQSEIRNPQPTMSISEPRAAFPLQAPAAAEETGALPFDIGEFKNASFRALAQFAATYILAQRDAEFYIFDQHAAAERALYEKLSAEAEKRSPARQGLLLPWVWETSAPEAAALSERLSDFLRLGYDVEPFGEAAFRVKAVPGVLGDSPKVRGVLEGLVGDLASGTIPKSWDALLARAACRGSIKAGDPLESGEMDRVIRGLQACRSPWSCPHGRPTFLRLSADDLARRFRRG